MKRILFLLTIALLNLGSGLCKTRQSLRIMSYNIRIGIGMDQQTNLKRIAEVINKIQPERWTVYANALDGSTNMQNWHG